MKPVHVESNAYIDFNVQKSNKDPRFEVDDYVWILKYKKLSKKATFNIDRKTFYKVENIVR